MIPPRPTRRDVLHLSGAAIVGLAGCAGRGTSDRAAGDTSTPTATARDFPHGVDTPETRKIRNPEGEPAVRSSAHSPSRDHTSQGEMESASNWVQEYWFVTAQNERDALEFAPSASDVDAAEAFVADTDLSRTTLLVQQYVVEQCTTVTLKRFEWKPVESGAEDAVEVRANYDDRRKENCDHESKHKPESGPTHDTGQGDSDSVPTEVRAIVGRIPVNATEVHGFRYGW